MITLKQRVIPLSFEKPLVELEHKILQIRELAETNSINAFVEIQQLESQVSKLRQENFNHLSPEQRVQIARHLQRPTTLDFIQMIADSWIELHGDRCGSDDAAIVGGLARLGGLPVVMLGHQKGRDTKENIARNFGMASPGGYRKAMRLMKHANLFGLPILTFIDTPGAWPGVEAEHKGQGEAIAHNLREMFCLDVPIIAR